MALIKRAAQPLSGANEVCHFVVCAIYNKKVNHYVWLVLSADNKVTKVTEMSQEFAFIMHFFANLITNSK